MNILSFSYSGDGPDAHDTSAAIVCDGVLVAAAEEERFTRRKHDNAFPLRAIDFCLRRAGLCMDQVDVIAFPEKPFRTGRDSRAAETDLACLQALRRVGRTRIGSVVHKRLLDAYLRVGPAFNFWMYPSIAAGFAALHECYGEIPPVRYYGHHHSHAAAAYFTSGLEHAAIATIDNVGGCYATVTWSACGDRITRLRAEPFTNSLGCFYYDCTRYLGLGKFGEGKTMGLAAYGNKEVYASLLASMIDTNGEDWYYYRQPPSPGLLGFPPRDSERITNAPYPDFAAACQQALEEAVERVVRSALAEANSDALCLCGGVAFNCSCNGALLRSAVASRLQVFPAAGDAGLAIGASLLCAAELGELRPTRLDHAYWGPEFTAGDYEAALADEPQVSFQRCANLAEEVAKLLVTGRVVGWFQGRMELGPRALGNRSILADPRTPEMRDRVNRIKGREAWRPLAPAVLAERAPEFFDLGQLSPFMLIATQMRPAKRSAAPGIVHIDGSVRPQTVTREQNSKLYDLISAFDRLTGLPMLLNTSFNAAGEPIVCTPADAIKTFLATGLDVLVLGDYLVRRRGASEQPAMVSHPR